MKKIKLQCSCGLKNCWVEFGKDDMTLWVVLKSHRMKRADDVVLDLKEVKKLKEIL